MGLIGTNTRPHLVYPPTFDPASSATTFRDDSSDRPLKRGGALIARCTDRAKHTYDSPAVSASVQQLGRPWQVSTSLLHRGWALLGSPWDEGPVACRPDSPTQPKNKKPEAQPTESQLTATQPMATQPLPPLPTAAAAATTTGVGSGRSPGGTSWPPQYPPYYNVKYFSQPVDHGNGERTARFRERYLENATHWGGPGAPILFYTGAEGSGVDAIFPHSGYVMALAEDLRALVVFAEMRFFGTSLPFGPNRSFLADPQHLGLLSIEQTLADYALLLASIKTQRKAEASPTIGTPCKRLKPPTRLVRAASCLRAASSDESLAAAAPCSRCSDQSAALTSPLL